MALTLSLVVLCAIALVGGAYAVYRRGMRKQALLMVVLAAIMALNVAIWTVPTQSGTSLVNASDKP